MAKLIDTSLWIDLTRRRSPPTLKRFVADYIEDREACLAEPIVFEMLRHVSDAEAQLLARQFSSVPLLVTPLDLWARGAELGRACRGQGIHAGSLDLLIAAVAIWHRAELITFDEDFEKIAAATALKVTRLHRPQLERATVFGPHDG